MADDKRTIEYDRAGKGFIMVGDELSMMTNSEILAVSKILLESRAFTRRELNTILNKLVEGCVPLKNVQLVGELISNEKYHYVELNHKEYIQDKLWEIGSDIHEHRLVSMHYARVNAPNESIKRVVEPIAILFSEYYFYLNAYIVEKNDGWTGSKTISIWRKDSKYRTPIVFKRASFGKGSSLCMPANCRKWY